VAARTLPGFVNRVGSGSFIMADGDADSDTSAVAVMSGVPTTAILKDSTSALLFSMLSSALLTAILTASSTSSTYQPSGASSLG